MLSSPPITASVQKTNENTTSIPVYTFDVKKEENSKIRYWMSYYGY